jgi:hypothetical protein
MSLPTELVKAAEEAQGVIEHSVQRPYFFEKLAANGHVPANTAEADAMWEAGVNLYASYHNEQQKTASARHVELSALNQCFQSQPSFEVEKQAAFGNVADIASNEPDIARSFLTLGLAAMAAAQPE